MNNNQGNTNMAGHNGEGNSSSLSAVRGNNHSTSDLANIGARRASTPHGMRAEDYKRSNVQALDDAKNKGLAQNERSAAEAASINAANAKRKIANLKMAAAQEIIKKYAAVHGVPEGVTQKAMDSKAGQVLMNKALNKKSLGKKAIDSIMNRGGGDTDKSKKDESEKTLDEKSDEQEQKRLQDGEINFALPLKAIKWLVILTPVITSVLMFMLIIVTALNDEKVSSMVIAGMVAKEKGEELIRDVQGKGDVSELAVGKAADDEFPASYYDRLKSLGNVFSSQAKCEGDECLEREEFLYYLKIADINLRYENKYHVTLDWYLIAATNLYFARSTEDTMKANLSSYNKDTVEDYDTLSELDWDNDFTNMPGYQYLDADDSRYDLNILAKNMVKKKTIQTCSDGNGIVKTQEDEDVEDMYFELGGKNRLSCAAGQKYSISSTYSLDKDKYDEFLLEYIDKKMYTAGSGKGNISSSSGNSLSNAFVNLAVDQMNDPSAKGGEKYWRHMGWNYRVAWCAAFVSWNIANTVHDGVPLSSIIKKQTSAVYEFMNYFYQSSDSNIQFYYNDNCSRLKGKNGSGSYTPKEGDLIFFDWQQTWDAKMPTCRGCGPDHVGIVQRVENGNIITIEGNTSDSVNEHNYPITSCKVIGFGSWY